MTEQQDQARAYIARREAVLDRLRRILVAQLHVQRKPEEIDPDVSLFGTGLGLDSVDAVELVLCLETEFGLQLPDQVVVRSAMRTVNTLAELVLAKEEQAHV